MWKKAIALLLALSTIFALTACGSKPNDGRGQSFLSEKTPTLSEYLNSKDPVIMYGANQIDKNANVGSIYVFENGKVLLAPFNASLGTITLGELAQMSDAEIITLATERATACNATGLPYMFSINTDSSGNYVERENLWLFDFRGMVSSLSINPYGFAGGQVYDSYYYGEGLLVRCEAGTKPYSTDELGTSGIVIDPQWDEMSKKMYAQHRFVDQNAEHFELYGVTIPKYADAEFTALEIGQPLSISEIEILDSKGNYVMTFGSNETARDLDHIKWTSTHTWQRAYPDRDTLTVRPGQIGGFTIDEQDNWCADFYNGTDSEISIWDLKCSYLRNDYGSQDAKKKAAEACLEKLGKPTAVYATWDTILALNNKRYVKDYYVVWECDGFYVFGWYYLSNEYEVRESGSECRYDLRKITFLSSDYASAYTGFNDIFFALGWK